jgi:hypothetical protein
MIGSCRALLVASLVPPMMSRAGNRYLAGALPLRLGFLVCVVGFARRRSQWRARGVLRASLIYWPALLSLLFLSRIPV